jgi:hypothetical protein
MSKHSVHKATDTGNFVVADDKGNILHTFPTEGEANLQVIALDNAEKEAKQAATGASKADDDHDEDEGKSARPHVGAQARHR